MHKISFSFLLLFFLCSAAVQAGEKESLVVWQKDGSRTVFLLEDLPEVSFRNDSLVVRSATVSALLPMSGIARFTYEGITLPDGLSDLSLPNGDRKLIQSADALLWTDVEANAPFSLCTVDGRPVEAEPMRSGHSILLSIESLLSGWYIATVGRETFKFRKP